MKRAKAHEHHALSTQPAGKEVTAELPARTHQPPLSVVMQRAAADPRSLTRADAVQLQRTIGNAAVRQLVTGATPRENRTGLPDKLKAGVENLSGFALDDVRVHYNSPQPAQVQALAYAQGTDIHVAPGQEQHLPHEAWHVVQQKQGRVAPTLQMKGVAINDDRALEREADTMGGRASGWSVGAADAALLPFRSPLRATQFATSRVLQAFSPLNWIKEQYHDYRRLSALNEVMQEAVATMNQPNVALRATGRSETARVPGGGHQVRINLNNPIPYDGAPPIADPDKIQAAFLHELTHVAVDRGYNGANFVGGPEFENMRQPGNDLERNALSARGARLQAILGQDQLIPPLERAFIRERLIYMQINPQAEFDTVANELLYYFHLKGIPALSELSKALTETVRERKRLRG